MANVLMLSILDFAKLITLAILNTWKKKIFIIS